MTNDTNKFTLVDFEIDAIKNWWGVSAIRFG
jgi:hypothetical protein